MTSEEREKAKAWVAAHPNAIDVLGEVGAWLRGALAALDVAEKQATESEAHAEVEAHAHDDALEETVALKKRLADAEKRVAALKRLVPMAREYAESGGFRGPEMREFNEVMDEIGEPRS